MSDLREAHEQAFREDFSPAAAVLEAIKVDEAML